jgi:acyl carrier protein
MRSITDLSALKRKLKEIVSNLLEIDIDTIKESAAIDKEFGATSIDLINLIAALEEEFGIEIDDEDIESLVTVNDAADYLARHLNPNPAR